MSSSATSTNLQHLLAARYCATRDFSTQIARPLSEADCAIQSMPDVSPTRWHLAHTTWFFETFLLSKLTGYECFAESFEYLFNSYYNSVGKQFPRERRGMISRPGIRETLDYRQHVDERLRQLLHEETLDEQQLQVLEIGLQHEQQHQELMLTDIKHVLSCNPLHPAYASAPVLKPRGGRREVGWFSEDEQLTQVGHELPECSGPAFAYDNESPRHNTLLAEHGVSTALVTNGEYLDFVESGGYSSPEHWLSLGWSTVRDQAWQHPLYWHRRNGQWFEFSLAGLIPLDPDRPVCHVSFFEADAFARWSGVRLPTEFEWEYHAAEMPEEDGVFADRLFASGNAIHPAAERGLPGQPERLSLGNLWEWTSSPYIAYPGYRPPEGALGEYNGKFMCNQFVLRGGSCATSSSHIRKTYRNFFPPEARWQFAGIRLAR